MDLYSDVSFSTSRLITHRYSTSFSIAVNCLPNEMRQAIYSIYGFVRLADEIVDTFETADQESLLLNFERDYLEALANRISLNPVLHSFILTLYRYNIPLHLVDSFLTSMKADLRIGKYYDSAGLDGYIYGSADVVGLMCLKVFVNGDEQLYHELEKPAKKLGSAFQKVNFLRDLKADIEQLNRSYFPGVDITTFNELKKLELIEEIGKDFQEAKEGVDRLPGRSRLAVLIAYTYYMHLLRKLSNTPAGDIISKRIRLPGHFKIFLFVKALLSYHTTSFKIKPDGRRIPETVYEQNREPG